MSIEAMKQMVRALEDTSASKHISRNSAIQAGLKAIADAEKQEPDDLTIAYMSGFHDGKKKREWVGLTDDDQETIMEWLGHDVSSQVFYAIETKLKEKNT
jgi:hypothetical protein